MNTAVSRWQLSLWLQIGNWKQTDQSYEGNDGTLKPFLSCCKGNQGEETQNGGHDIE